MPKAMRGGFRLLAAVAVFAMLGAYADDLGAVAGRDFSRCIQQCNDVRRACDGNCKDECQLLFPNDSSARDACVAACKSVCAAASDECKLVCQEIKDDSPVDP